MDTGRLFGNSPQPAIDADLDSPSILDGKHLYKHTRMDGVNPRLFLLHLSGIHDENQVYEQQVSASTLDCHVFWTAGVRVCGQRSW